MRKASIIASLLAVVSAGTAWADTTQQVTGATVSSFITGLSFSGDQVTLSLEDGGTQVVDDMAGLSISLTYDGSTGIASLNSDAQKIATSKQGVFTLDGRYKGNSTKNLAKGVYIVNGKKTIIK